MHIGHVDVAGAQRDALAEDLQALVGHRGEHARHDLVVADRAARDVQLLGDMLDQRLHGRVGRGAPALVEVVALGGLLAEAAELAEAIRDRRVAQAMVAELLAVLAYAPADVQARHVAHQVQAHRKAEALQRTIDLPRRRAFLEQEVAFTAVDREDAVADEAVGIAGQHAYLADGFGERHRRRDGLRRGLAGAHHLEQLHHVGGAEEMRADHALGP